MKTAPVILSARQLLTRWTWLFLGCLLDALVFLVIGIAMLIYMPRHNIAALWLTAFGGLGAAACAGAAMHCLNKLALAGQDQRRSWIAFFSNHLFCRALAVVQFVTFLAALLAVGMRLLGFDVSVLKL